MSTSVSSLADSIEVSIVLEGCGASSEVTIVNSTTEVTLEFDTGGILTEISPVVENIKVELMDSDLNMLVAQISNDDGNALSVGTDDKLYAPYFSWGSTQW